MAGTLHDIRRVRLLRWSAGLALAALASVLPHTGCLLTTELDGLAGERPVDSGAPDGCASGRADCDESPGCETVVTTDTKHCGECGHDCQGGVCESGVCKPVSLGGTSGAKAMAFDDASVFWINDQGAVQSMPKSGGTPTLMASGQGLGDSPSIAVDADSVCWGTSITVLIATKTTKAVSTIASSQSKPKSVTLYGSSVYWINDKSVMRASKTGGEPTILATEENAPEQLRVGSDGVYWVVYFSNELRFLAHAGSQPQTLNAEYVRPKSLAIDATSVYVAENGPGEGFNNGIVSRIPKGGGTRTILATTQAYPQGIDVDESAVYWANFNGSTVVRVTKDGVGVPVKIADAQTPTLVVVPANDPFAWWIASSGISKVAR